MTIDGAIHELSLLALAHGLSGDETERAIGLLRARYDELSASMGTSPSLSMRDVDACLSRIEQAA